MAEIDKFEEHQRADAVTYLFDKSIDNIDKRRIRIT